MSQYTTGTVTVTLGSQLVTGSDTKWKNVIKQGDMFVVADNPYIYEVAYVVSDSELYLSSAYSQMDASGATYALVRDFTPFRRYPELKIGDREPAAIITKAFEMIDEDLHFLRSLYYPEILAYESVALLENGDHNSRIGFDIAYLAEAYSLQLSTLIVYDTLSVSDDNIIY